MKPGIIIYMIIPGYFQLKVLRIRDIEPLEASPVLMNSKDGSAKFIKIFDGYFYSDIYTYKDFFFSSINRTGLDWVQL